MVVAISVAFTVVSFLVFLYSFFTVVDFPQEANPNMAYISGSIVMISLIVLMAVTW